MSQLTIALTLVLVVAPHALVLALNNGLALRPPMGFINWARFLCTLDCRQFPDECVSQKLFLRTADAMVSKGYRDAGYQYVNIDDCWSTMQRNPEDQRLVADPERFADGIKHLAQEMHSRNLKLGIYGDCGTKTCAGYPAQLKTESQLEDNYFQLDADTLVDWEVDSFKFDGCNLKVELAESICPKFTDALINAKKPILLTCEWPFYMLVSGLAPDFELAQKSCNMWRYYNDVEDSWVSILGIVDFTIKMQNTIAKYHGPGNWFDPDQLVIGNFGLSVDQARAQMALWSIWSAPLFISTDLSKIEDEFAEILLNKELIQVNQDRLGVFGLMALETKLSRFQAFVKPVEPIKNGCPSFVILYLSRSTLGNGDLVKFKIRDLLQKSAIGVAAERYASSSSQTNAFVANDCRARLANAMTKLPHPGLEDLVSRPGVGQAAPLEQQSVVYSVRDLIEHEALDPVTLNGELELLVVPSGVRVVKLEES